MTKNRHPAAVLAVLALVAALVIRAALPLGWMPSQTDQGIRVMLCSGKGTIVLPLATPDQPASDPASQEDGPPRDPCPFGLSLAMAFDLPSVAQAAGPPHLAQALADPQAITARITAARSLRPPARGPPRFA
jgi:Protein of unknown function (DUF2946)